MQRRVDQPDRDRQAVHRLEDLDEVLALQRQQRGERRLLAGLVLGQDQVLDQLAALAEEHVLGAAQADALGAEPAGAGGVLGGVGVGPDPSRRTPSACSMIRATASTSVARRTSSPSKWRTTSESDTGTSPANTSPVVPSIEIRSPSCTIGAVADPELPAP